jgi:DNA anti-recombination protein RmuC
MTGRQEPSSEQLRQSLHKRFNRVGTALNQVSNNLDAAHSDAKSGDNCNAASTIILKPSVLCLH